MKPKIMNIIWDIKVFLCWVKKSLIIIMKVASVYKNAGTVIFSRFTNKRKIFYLRNGLKFNVRPQEDDRAMINEIFILKPYIKGGFIIDSDDIVVDVGAYIGAFTIYAANIAKNGKVYSIEPIKEHFRLLNRNIRLNELKNVISYNLALGNSNGLKHIYISKTRSSFFGNKQNEAQLVKVTTLKTFLNENNLQVVNFLKMDCEGSEFDILLNSNEDALNRVQKVAMEYHNLSSEKNVEVLKCHLEKMGFQVQAHGGEWDGHLFAKNNKL